MTPLTRILSEILCKICMVIDLYILCHLVHKLWKSVKNCGHGSLSKSGQNHVFCAFSMAPWQPVFANGAGCMELFIPRSRERFLYPAPITLVLMGKKIIKRIKTVALYTTKGKGLICTSLH